MDNTKSASNTTLVGLCLGVTTFWLFAQTMLNIGPIVAKDLGVSPSIMNGAISASALFSGMTIVAFGGLADRLGRKRVFLVGSTANLVGSLLIALAAGPWPVGLLLAGRTIQGVAAGAIMPSSLALITALWEGPDRQRAISWWSIGTFGGSSLCALFGGIIASSAVGWRGIFFMSAIVSVIAMLLVLKTPESKAPATATPLDIPGMILLGITMVALNIAITQAAALGITSMALWAIVGVMLISGTVWVVVERRSPAPVVDFSLFKRRAFAGTVASNFLVNCTAGIVPVSMWSLQQAHGFTAAQAGYLSLGFAVFVISCIRLGEKVLRAVGPEAPMFSAAILLTVALVMAAMTFLPTQTYAVVVAVAFCIFGLGLALYATPATATAMAALPEEQAGAGAGIFKMASSLGAASGVAIAASVFSAISEKGGLSLPLWANAGETQPVAEGAAVALIVTTFFALGATITVFLSRPLQHTNA